PPRLPQPVAGPVAGPEHLRRQVGEAPARLVAVQQLDVVEPPAALPGDQLALAGDALRARRDPQVAAPLEPDSGARQPDVLVEALERRDRLLDQPRLVLVVELGPV